MTRAAPLAGLALAVLAAASIPAAGLVPQPAIAAPVIDVDTSKGRFSIETFPTEAPVTVAHVTALVRAGFYSGLRVHRALPQFLIQFGDPQTRDLDARHVWGRGRSAASGKPVGVVEINSRRLHRKGAVGLAHIGLPAQGDSQIYVTLDRRPDLDGRYTVFGQVAAGDDVPGRLEVGDIITALSVRE